MGQQEEGCGREDPRLWGKGGVGGAPSTRKRGRA